MKQAFWSGFEKQAKVLDHMTKRQASRFFNQQAREGIGFIPGTAAWVAKKMGLKNGPALKVIKGVQEPILKADMELGYHADKLMNKLPKWMPGKKLFKMEERINVGKPGQRLSETFDRPSIVAPIHKSMEVAKPIIVAGAISKAIDAHRKRKHEQQPQY